MRIAYVMQNYNATSELWLQRQIELLKNDISFLAAIDNDERLWGNKIPVINLYSDYPIIYKALIKFRVLRERTSQERYNKVLKRHLNHNIDIVFVNYLTLAYELKDVLLACKQPVVIHTHGYDITWDLRSMGTGEKIYNDEYIEFARNLSEKAVFIANSNYSKNNILKIDIPENKVFVKYFGVTIESQYRKPSANNNIKILYLGRLVDSKSPDLVIKAFEMACDRGLNGELIIAGGGYLENTCKIMAKRSRYADRIKLLGVVDSNQGKELRQECDIFTAHNCEGVLTHQTEAFGVSIIEAMAAGMPVVTGKSGGVVESVVDGETGFLFSPGNVEEHADKLLVLANDEKLRLRLGNNGIERAKKYFSVECESESLKMILQEAAASID